VPPDEPEGIDLSYLTEDPVAQVKLHEQARVAGEKYLEDLPTSDGTFDGERLD
jgi:hypothetical protein